MTTAAAPGIGWRDPHYLFTHRGLLAFFVPGEARVAQAEPDQAPKNLVIARHPERGWRLIRLATTSETVPPRDDIIAALSDPARSAVVEGVAIEEVAGAHNVALRHAQLYLSAGRGPDVGFKAARRLSWETFEAITPGPLAYQLWRPERTMGGTQLVQIGLTERLGAELQAIDLQLHWPNLKQRDERPLVVWLHNNATDAFKWCADPEKTRHVAAFVFVSHWQRQRFLRTFPALPAERCHVIRNATETEAPIRSWPAEKPWRWRCAYTSAPDRGLSVLLDAWERLDPADAELHVWSSFRLWGKRYSDGGSNSVLAQARRLRGVTYHGIRPNAEIRAALREMHFLVYPTTFEETSCIAAIEAMTAGVRVIATARAAIPETTAGFAHLYAKPAEREDHIDYFARELAAEFHSPWGGRPALATAVQEYARLVHSWPACVTAWRQLIEQLTSARETRESVPEAASGTAP